MLKRNLSLKEGPQKWQENSADGFFDVICAFEERVFDIINEGMAAWSFSLETVRILKVPVPNGELG